MDITYGPLLRTGPFGTDYLGMNTITGEFVAIREVQGLEESKLEDLTCSLDSLKAKSLQHANLITHLGYEPGDSSVIVFSEYVIGHGTISSYVQQHGSFDDSIIRSFTRQIILGLEYLQSEGVAHNNLNSSTIFVDPNGTVKMADFGVPPIMNGSQLSTIQSQEDNCKPDESHVNKVNVWSLGVIVLEMTRGQPPSENDIKTMSEKSGNGTYIFDGGRSESFLEGLSFVRDCLTVDLGMRPTTSLLLDHPLCVLTHGYDFQQTELLKKLHEDTIRECTEWDDGSL